MLKRQDILVIPVIVMGTSLPVREELPESLYELIYRNAVVIRNDPDFDTDMRRLIRQIRSSAPITQKVSPKVGLGIISLLLLVALAFAGLTFLVKPPPRALTPVVTTVYSQTTPSSANEVSDISVGAGFGARGKGWQLFFTNPGNNQSPATLIDASKLMNTTIIASRAVSLFQEPNQDSMIVLRVPAGDSFLITQANADNSWMHVRLQDNTDGWILTDDIVLVSATPLAVSAKSQYGINIRLVDAIGRAKKELDIAAFMLDEEEITKAILEAHQSGITVRVVTDDESGLEDPENTFQQLVNAGIPVVVDKRAALMHDKFMIIDTTSVWTGSWNYTKNSTFNNNENTIVFNSPQITALYKAEFNKMFEQAQFGPHKSPNQLNQVDIPDGSVNVYFTPEDDVEPKIIERLSSAQSSIRLLAFSFTHDAYRDAILEAIKKGVKFQGIIEKTGGALGEFPTLFCAGADTRFDGNSYFLHHNVIVIDDSIVITGSMNFTTNALETNDENVVIVDNKALAAAYNAEFERLWGVAVKPTDISC